MPELDATAAGRQAHLKKSADAAERCPRITIGIACFNAENTIREAIASALAQVWPDIEVLVVDDFSTDASAAIVEELAEEDPRVRLIRHPRNTGPGGTRNSIVQEATGEMIAFFDDDDESDPSRLATQFNRIERFVKKAGTDLVACYASGGRVYPNGYLRESQAIGSQGIPPSGDAVAEYLLFHGRRPDLFYGGGTPTCALMAPTATFRRLGGFDPDFRRVEDVDFAVRLALAGGHFIGCPESLYRQRATVAEDKTPRKNYESELRLLEKHREFLEDRGRYDYARRWFTMRYHHFSGARCRMVTALVALWLRYPMAVTRHLLSTGPARIRHERRMKRKGV